MIKATRSPAAEWAIFAVVVLLAALARWPQLNVVPPYTDETEEALRAWRIAQGELLPLTSVDAYIGALWGYVVALGFKLAGRGPEVPRAASLIAGSLTVGFGYLLARELFGRAAAIVAAPLLIGNATHILVNSHVSWSNCATPVFTTAAWWLLARWSARHGAGPSPAGLLVGAGLLFGAALQTHPSVAAFLPGALAYVLWRDRRLPLRPESWIAVCAFLVGYANVLAYNVSSGFDSLRQAQRVSSEYSEGGSLDPFGYLASVAGFLVLVGQTLGGGVEARYTALEYVLDPLVMGSFLLGVSALIWTARRGEPLPLFVFVSAFLALPVLNQRWAPIMESRYLMPMIPLCLAASGALLASLGQRLFRHPAAAPVAAATLAGAQLVALGHYYSVEIAAGRSNAEALEMVRVVDAQRRAREPFVVDSDLHLLPTGGGGTWAKALDYILQLEGVRRDVESRNPEARLRACEVEWVELWYVQRDQRRNARVDDDEPRHEAYWVARPERGRPPTGNDNTRLVTRAPYVVPFRPHSLFDERVPTFDTGCE